MAWSACLGGAPRGVLAVLLLGCASADSGDIIKKVVNTPWWPAGSEKTAESVGIISHGFVYMTAMMELNETLEKTMLQETWDVRDIAFAAGANLSDLVDCLVNAPKGQGETVRAALMSVLPASVRASPPALTVVEMPGEYQFVGNSIACVANIPDGKSARQSWRHKGIYAVSARGLMFLEGSLASSDCEGDAFHETEDIARRMLETSGNDSTLVDCTAFVAQISEASEVRRAIKEVTQTTKVVPALTIVQAQRLPKKSVLLRCTADVSGGAQQLRSESEESTEGLVLTQSFAFTSAQLAWNSTGLDALESLGRLLQRAQLTLKEVISCSFFVKDQNKVFDLFGGFFQVFNQELMRTGSPRENPPPPARGEYEAPSECAECQVAAKCVAARKAPTDLEMLV
ncbi:unnamed protein product [Durusdinium trenchii]|uniref:Chloroplastic n=2 Tax=Durusdinium trenchii TaxID=1381693 RepID=A0ABP0S1I9_9DINO